MTISIKTSTEIKKMRAAGKLAANVLEMIAPYIIPGVTTSTLDKICNTYIIKHQKAIPACLGYQGFPKSICTSINEEVCHGIPSNKKLKKGDIINIDVSIIKDGWYSDTSKMFIVGESTILSKKLCQVTKKSLYLAILAIKPGMKLCNIGKIIQNYVEQKQFSVVRDYCGHGIGRYFHEEPQVLHYDNIKYNKLVLKAGMVFTIEPMVNSGTHHVEIMQDGWTVKTKDNSLSAQYEHTILVTTNGCEILTLRGNESLPRFTAHKS